MVMLMSFYEHQGDPLGRPLFSLAHIRALWSVTNHLLACLFSTIAHDTRIIGIPSIVSLTFEYIETQLHIIGLFLQPHKCVVWSLFGII